jgi:hypothetical protein
MTTSDFKMTSATATADWREPRELAFEEVADAIIKLSTIDETTLLEHAGNGDLASLLPYTVVGSESPQLEAWDDVAEAPGRSLSDEEHERWLRGR